MTKITHFAQTESKNGGWDLETGMPTSAYFGNALQVWSLAQDRPVTVAEAALAFNVTPALIRECIDDDSWMYLDGEWIEHDGE